eukprot:CAMPEP_0116898374 /NCGR_PEP_ID=MMETSP0467-20121206/7100_1 /TAXON_ID=283647 /ORGANISM="Mesodinium pulex, Strain SPMC105" /LENGTH=58 /DNA_ID=CAMNT_0004570445 /DNA_START=394 /DNA_END=570 /DNA_ORIENTATION=-
MGVFQHNNLVSTEKTGNFMPEMLAIKRNNYMHNAGLKIDMSANTFFEGFVDNMNNRSG